jgi:NTP pyrophosphatase (non-canonical NTP hydrolase)
MGNGEMVKEMGTLPDQITLSYLQEYIRKKDHEPELKHAYFLKLIEEVGELAEVLLEGRRMEAQNIKEL